MRYAVGIDLGTTNSALAWVDLDERPPRVRTDAIAQLVAPGDVARRPTLPSFLYLPGEHELPAGASRLPWTERGAPDPKAIVGELARAQGAQVPGHLVSSAKSWLCHPGVDRQAAILPWAAPPEVARLSPVDASAAYLRHLDAAFRADHGVGLAATDLVLTVPASFDEVARELTVEAAARAGLERLVLLEEPQAAFYAWIEAQAESPEAQPNSIEPLLAAGATVLVLLLGGDNMDLALARRVERALAARAGKLDAARFQALVQACRIAKEKLLGEGAPESWTIHVGGRGRSLVGGGGSVELTRAEAHEALVDGFFPIAPRDAEPQRAAGSGIGLREFGLPFAHDPAVTRHLAAFLRRHGARPDAILFNGGVLHARAIRERIVEAVAHLDPDGRRPAVLASAQPDLAVARGAAYYALARRTEALRPSLIEAGAARAYYVEVEAAGEGESTRVEPGTVTALCVAARGEREAGERVEVGLGSGAGARAFEVLTNRPVRFRLLSSSERSERVGDLVTLPREQLAELPPIVTVLRFARSSQDVPLPVALQVERTALGTLELHLVPVGAEGQRYKLAFDLRAAEQAPVVADEERAEPAAEAIAPERVAAAEEVVRRVFDKAHPEPLPPAQAMKELAAALGRERGEWPTAALRSLWEPLKALRGQRGRTAEHEARWLNLVGYVLRPGWGYPLDDWRVKEAWRLWNAGLVHDKESRCRLEWWILWRRVAGGLTRTMQDELWKRITPHFLPDAKKKAERKAPAAQEAAEMWRVAGSLERLPAQEKAKLAEVALAQLAKDVERGGERLKAAEPLVWALGRLGARVPLYGPVENVVAPARAAKWVERLLALDWASDSSRLGHNSLAFATAEIARASGDRGRDLDEPLRQRVAARLASESGGARLAKLVLEPTALEAGEERFAFGEALPVGLRLTSTEGRGGEEA